MSLHLHRQCSGIRFTPLSAGGFTLIEILLVVVLIAVAVAIIAPSFVSLTGGSIDDEARRMQQVFRLCSEETQLTGIPIRAVVLKGSYRFEQLFDVRQEGDTEVSEKEWRPFGEEPFAAHSFVDGIEIGEIRFSGSVNESRNSQSEEKHEENYVGRLYFWPDGMLDAADLTLVAPAESAERQLQLRSGPGGIRLAGDGST